MNRKTKTKTKQAKSLLRSKVTGQSAALRLENHAAEAQWAQIWWKDLRGSLSEPWDFFFPEFLISRCHSRSSQWGMEEMLLCPGRRRGKESFWKIPEHSVLRRAAFRRIHFIRNLLWRKRFQPQTPPTVLAHPIRCQEKHSKSSQLRGSGAPKDQVPSWGYKCVSFLCRFTAASLSPSSCHIRYVCLLQIRGQEAGDVASRWNACLQESGPGHVIFSTVGKKKRRKKKRKKRKRRKNRKEEEERVVMMLIIIPIRTTWRDEEI